jgi:hypothetical protein
MGYATRYFMNNEEREYFWKDNSTQIVYRKSRYIKKNELISVLENESVSVENINFEQIQNPLVKAYLLKLFGIENAFVQRSGDKIIYGTYKSGSNWRVTWEIEGYENTMIDSLSKPTTKFDSTLAHISIEDSLLTIDGWQFEKDKYEQMPEPFKPSLFDPRIIEQNDGSVIALKENISFQQGISFISDLKKILGDPTFQLVHFVGPSQYFWAWKDGIVIITLSPPFSLNEINSNSTSQIALFSGKNESKEFILQPY